MGILVRTVSHPGRYILVWPLIRSRAVRGAYRSGSRATNTTGETTTALADTSPSVAVLVRTPVRFMESPTL